MTFSESSPFHILVTSYQLVCQVPTVSAHLSTDWIVVSGSRAYTIAADLH